MLARLATIGVALVLHACTPDAPPATLWSDAEIRVLRSLSLDALGSVPPSPGNRVADDPRAIELGRALFADHRLSDNDEIACATCHQPERYFTDGLTRGVGQGQTMRNTPSIVGSAWQTWFYWDGRRDSLWAQALNPIEALDEMGGNRLAGARLIGSDAVYRSAYEALFGPFPDALLSAELPANAGPYGLPPVRDAWQRLGREQRATINRVFANIGKAIAAWERTRTPGRSAFDRYVEVLLDQGEAAAAAAAYLDEEAIQGAKLFIDAATTQCLQCHNGPLLSNGDFHNIGSGTFVGEVLDLGRVIGVQAVLVDEFNCLGPYSDADPQQCHALRFLSRDSHATLAGAFKVPSLRNVAATAPYLHDGRYATLNQVMQHYNHPPASEDSAHELRALNLSDAQLAQLVAFMQAL